MSAAPAPRRTGGPPTDVGGAPAPARGRPTVVLTAFDRPGYLRRTLGALRANDLAGWRLTAALEPGNAHVRALVEGFDAAPFEVTVNRRVRGVRKNPHQALERAFDAGADLVLYVEDDVLLSPDATALAAWFGAHPARDTALALCLCAYASDPGRPVDVVATADPVRPAGVARVVPLGMVLTRHAWRRWFRRHWFEGVGWDYGVSAPLERGEAVLWQPAWSRSNHIGRLHGRNCEAAFHDRVFGALPWNRRARHTGFRLVDAGPAPIHAPLRPRRP